MDLIVCSGGRDADAAAGGTVMAYCTIASLTYSCTMVHSVMDVGVEDTVTTATVVWISIS